MSNKFKGNMAQFLEENKLQCTTNMPLRRPTLINEHSFKDQTINVGDPSQGKKKGRPDGKRKVSNLRSKQVRKKIHLQVQKISSPIRSLIESGFEAGKRPDVRLYYGARNLQRMVYQDRLREWEASGIKIVPVLSLPDDSWTGERGYAAFAGAKNIYNPQGTGVLPCGHKQMTEEVTSLLLADGVSRERY